MPNAPSDLEGLASTTASEAIEQYVLWRKAHGAKLTTRENRRFGVPSRVATCRQLLRHADGDAECDAVSTAQVLAFLAGAGPLTRHRENKYYSADPMTSPTSGGIP